MNILNNITGQFRELSQNHKFAFAMYMVMASASIIAITNGEVLLPLLFLAVAGLNLYMKDLPLNALDRHPNKVLWVGTFTLCAIIIYGGYQLKQIMTFDIVELLNSEPKPPVSAVEHIWQTAINIFTTWAALWLTQSLLALWLTFKKPQEA